MRTGAVICLFAVAVLVFFFDVIFEDRVLLTANPAAYQPWRTYAAGPAAGGRDYRTDSILTYLPRQAELARSLAHGRLPLWNPYILGGMPFFADPQSRALYPISLLLAAFGAEKAMGYDVAIHFFLALVGMYLFLRIISTSTLGSMLGAFAYGFSSFFFTRMGHPTFVASAAWIPFFFYGFEKARAGGRGGTIWLAVFFALGYLAGFPQVLLFGVASLVVYGILVPPDRPGWRHKTFGTHGLATARTIGTAGAIALLAVCVQLVPFWEYLRNSVGLGIPFDQMKTLYVSKPSMLLRSAFPGLFGNPAEGTSWLPLVQPGIHPYNLGLLVYCGAGTLLIAVGSLVFVGRSAQVRAFLVMLAATLLIGTSGIVLKVVYSAVPFFRYSQVDRISVVGCFALAALAGKGLSLAARSEDNHIRRLFGAVMIAGAAALAVAAAAFTLGGGGLSAHFTGPASSLLAGLPQVGAERVREWVSSGGAGLVDYEKSQLMRGLIFMSVSTLLAVIFLVAPRKRILVAMPWVLVVWIVVDLASVARTYYVSQASPAVYETAGIGALRELTHGGEWRVMATGRDPAALPPNTNQIFEIASLDGRSTIMPRSFIYLLKAGVKRSPGGGGPEIGTVPSLELAAFMGARYIIGSSYLPQSSGYDLVYEGDMLVYENRAALPKAVCVDRGAFQVARDKGVAMLGVSSRLSGVGDAQCGDARIVAYEPERLEIDVSAVRDCYLLVADAWYPGWRALVDGKPVDLAMTDVGTRAVALPEGRHSVVMEFKPGSLRLGLVLSCVGLLIGVLYAVKARSKGRA
jgi:hypothetical protein